jgi:hypothetical protein
MAASFIWMAQAVQRLSVSSSLLSGWTILGHLTDRTVQIVAAIIALLNDNRLAQGKPPLGFLNPWLYGRARAGFTDITQGWNPGCNTQGFPSVVGWDPVSPGNLLSIHFC